jgi:hypothetical protein
MSANALSAPVAVLAACLVTLDEGGEALSGRELAAIVERRKAQMAFIRRSAAELGGVSAISDDDWASANLWVQLNLPDGYNATKRALAVDLVAALAVRKALEAVSAVVQWDGVTKDGEFAWLEALARAARLDDRATLEDIQRVGKRLARAR